MRGELSTSLGQPRYKGPYFDTQKKPQIQEFWYTTVMQGFNINRTIQDLENISPKPWTLNPQPREAAEGLEFSGAPTGSLQGVAIGLWSARGHMT